jgi:Fis family transcriptional regulator
MDNLLGSKTAPKSTVPMGLNQRVSGNRGAIGSMTANDPDNSVNAFTTPPLRAQVQCALQSYFSQLDGHTPSNLYKMVLEQVEPPLLETVLYHTQGNQTKAADILGINRSTLRKKLKQYGID